jgi:hypothetical protein
MPGECFFANGDFDFYDDELGDFLLFSEPLDLLLYKS